MDWFNGCVDQSLTYSIWRKIEIKISNILKQNVEKKLMDPVNRQILFQILGDDFVKKYFPSYTNSPGLLDNVRPDERERRVSEIKLYISTVVDAALNRNGPKSDSKIQNDLSAFSSELQRSVEASFLEGSVESNSRKKHKTDLHEKYLVEILVNEDHIINDMIPKLKEQLIVLSNDLRLAVWPVCSLRKDQTKNKKDCERMKEKVSLHYRKLNDSFDNNTNKQIQFSVSKVYNESKFLEKEQSKDGRKSCTIILSLCDSSGKKFQHHFAFYAAVVQQLWLEDSTKAPNDKYVDAAIFLNQILKFCIPNMKRCSKIIDRVHELLSEIDKQLYDHITKIVSEDKNIHSENNKPQKNIDVKFYLSNWITSAFVFILKPNMLLFVWDQLFYNKFENKIYEDVCFAFLELLKPWFLRTKDKASLQKVFMEEPSLLYLLDVKNALQHIQNKGDLLAVSSMNRNIRTSSENPFVIPPDPLEKVTPVPPSPKPKIAPKLIPWVPCDKEKLKDLQPGTKKVDLPFDLYLDSVRFIPDNSTVVKIAGKLLNMYLGQKGKSIKFQAYPELDSYWRYPKFSFKQEVNLESIPMNPDAVMILRVYTVEQHSKNVFVIGSCLFGPFSNKHGMQATLRSGGHQLRVRHGLPDPEFNVENMLASHMDDNPVIPGMTVLLRVLPHSEDYIRAPDYEASCYRSEQARPNHSESKLYKHYQESECISMTVREKALLLMKQTSASDSAVKLSIQELFSNQGSEIEDFPYQRYVKYNKNHGVMILVDKASGLPIFLEGRYFECLAQVFPGEDTKVGNGKSQVISFATNVLELDSYQRAPDWSDKPKNIKPQYADRAFVLVCLYGLRPRFDVATQRLIDKEGREPRFNLQQAVAWSAVPIFEKGSVLSGIHHVPLLKGRPPDDIIEKLSYLPLDYICKKFKNEVKVFESASIEVSVWDGHFSNNECPPLPVHTQLLNISSNPSRYLKAAEQKTGATALDLLKKSVQDPADFPIHKTKIVELLQEAFKNNFDASLLKEGYSAAIS